MKTLITAVAFATVLAFPAFAQSYDPDLGSGNIAPPAYTQAPGSAYDAFARVPDHVPAAGANHGIVMPHGTVATDPDPNIRFQLNREAEEGEW